MDRSLLDSPTYRVFRVMGRHKAVLASELEKLGLHLGQEIYLAQLWREDGLTGRELAERAGVSAPATTKVVQALERTGLVRRDRDPSDGRLVRVWLTEAGRALREPVTGIWYANERATWADLADDVRADVRTAVAELLDL